MKRIAVVTGSRAEYGLLKPLIVALQRDNAFELKLLVTGMHLLPKFGNTFKQIEADGIKIDYKVEDYLDGDSAKDITNAVAHAMMGFASVFKTLSPDMLLVLGDRSEIFAAASAAMIASIPIAHIHGGEVTEGAYDEFIRHAITKMSHLHFASTETYRNRIVQLGEHPSRVFNVGAIGIDSIVSLELLGKNDFEKSISKQLDKKSILITYHPVTLENNTAKKHFQALLDAIDSLSETTLIFTKPNADKGGRIISKMIDEYVSINADKAVSFTSLGQLRYLSALKHVSFVIGNSSSGILEVPYFNIPTVNIGDRQRGRVSPYSVINSKPEFDCIVEAIKKAGDKNFLTKIKSQENLYGSGNTTAKIVSALKAFDILKIKKSFYDINI
ncbi:MAG: UDP-N-acetylglucosamine 2-epimerase [Bacteroidota bacterium]